MMAMITGDGTGPHLTADERATLEWLRSIDLSETFGFDTVIVEEKYLLPPVGRPTILYIVQNDQGSSAYVWEPSQYHYRLIMQDPHTINLIKGGTANG